MTHPQAPTPQPVVSDSRTEEMALVRATAFLLDSWKLIAKIGGFIFVLVLLYAIFAPPVFTPAALVQVDEKAGGLTGLETLSSLIEGTALPVEAEIQLSRSSSVLRAAILAQHIDLTVRPREIPIVGSFLARRYQGTGPAPAHLGLSGFSWGGDHILVSQFTLPHGLYDEDFKLTVVAPDSFQLYDPSGKLLLTSHTGDVAYWVNPAGNDSVSIKVAALSARPGVSFWIQRRTMQETIAALGVNLQVAEQGSQSGILLLTVSGHDPKAITDLLTAIVRADVDLNRSIRSEEAASQIEFLQDQLPLTQQRVDSARRQLGSFQSKNKVLDMDDESKAFLDRLTAIDAAITTAALQRAQIQQQFGRASPALRTIIAQQDTLQAQKDALEAQLAKLPVAAQSVLQLQENLEVATGLYTSLLTSIQQLELVKAGTVGDVSVVDFPTVPDKPSGPPRLLIIFVGVLAGLIGGSSVAFIRAVFLQRVQDPTVIEARFKLPVLAVLPFSAEQSKLERALSDGQGREPLLAEEDPHAPAIEAIRGLRTSLHFLASVDQHPVVCISGPISGVGKSFISANLGRLAADAGTRVLIVDADMRRGHLHRYFGIPQEPGLSKLLSESVDPSELIRRTNVETLDVLTAGLHPPNPAELLLRPTLAAFFEFAKRRYDLIIVDAPPVLPVTDGIIVARLASMNIVVARAGEHTLRELDATISRYQQNGVRPSGFLVNCLRSHAAGYGYHYAYYKYEADHG